MHRLMHRARSLGAALLALFALVALFSGAAAVRAVAPRTEWTILPPGEGLMINAVANSRPGDKLRVVKGTAYVNGKAIGAGTWSPTASQVEEAEARLPGYLQREGHAKHAREIGRYRRQYVGFTRAGRRLIYLNAFHEEFLAAITCGKDAEPRDSQWCKPADAWRREMLEVDDGGDHFWHAEYDPAAKQFAGLAFNGVA